MKALDEVRGWPVETVAAGYLDRLRRRRTVGATAASRPLASVTKPLFAYAVLVAVEEGTLSLDQPAGPPGATIAHLLAHASGLGDSPGLTLAPVGKRRIYSNAGFEELGRELAAASAMSASEYFHQAVVEPLGLTSTALGPSPAHGATSSVDDLLVMAAEWLRPTLISAETMARATSPQFPELGGVLPGYGRQEPNPWGLGFELKGAKHPHWTAVTNSPVTFGHFGQAGTFIWIDPVIEVGCVALTNRPFGPWAIEAWPALAEAVVAEATGG